MFIGNLMNNIKLLIKADIIAILMVTATFIILGVSINDSGELFKHAYDISSSILLVYYMIKEYII